MMKRLTTFSGLLSMGGYVQGCATDPLFTSSNLFAFNATGSGLPLNSVFGPGQVFNPTAGDITNDEFIEMIFVYDPERGVGKKIQAKVSNYLNNVSASLPASSIY